MALLLHLNASGRLYLAEYTGAPYVQRISEYIYIYITLYIYIGNSRYSARLFPRFWVE